MTGTAYVLDAYSFSDKEKAQIVEFSNRIPLTDFNRIVQYGGGIQKKIADFSGIILTSMQGHVSDDIGDKLVNTVNAMKTQDQSKNSVFSFFKKKEGPKTTRAEVLGSDSRIDKAVFLLDDFQVQLLKDNAKLKQLRHKNKVFNKELSMYVAAGKLRLEEEKKRIADTESKNQSLIQMTDRFEKKIQDLEVTGLISKQMVPMIELIRKNNMSVIHQIRMIKRQMDSVHSSNIELLKGLDEVLRVRRECEMARARAEAEIRKLKAELNKEI